jgi:hypothetical protein
MVIVHPEAAMTSPIDPNRRAQPSRRPRRASDPANETFDAGYSTNLPVPIGQSRTADPPHPANIGAGIEAQLLGQTGARRGLRAGPTVIDTAQNAYNKIEWSGKHDRRAPTGRAAKTEV